VSRDRHETDKRHLEVLPDMLVRNPVQRRIVFGSTEEPTVAEYAFCKHKTASVSLHECMDCKRSERFPDRSKGETMLLCRGSRELIHVSAEHVPPFPLAGLGGQTFACVSANTPWATLVSLTVEGAMDALPVVDADGRPIGMIAKGDLLHHSGEGTTASDVMNPVVHSVPEDAPLSYAVALLAMHGLDHVPIVSLTGKVSGLFGARDAVRLLAEELGYVGALTKT